MLPLKTAITAVQHFGGQALPVGLNCPFPDISINRKFTAEENHEIHQGVSRLYCVGWISYRDGAGDLRITGFCRELVASPNTLIRFDNCRFRKFRDPDYEYED